MATFCIPKNLVNKLKDSAVGNEVTINKLYDMTPQEREAYFAKYSDKELGKFVSSKVEEALVSKQKATLTEFIDGLFTASEKKQSSYKEAIEKINSLGELGILDNKAEKVLVEDLISTKLGATVSSDELKVIQEKASKIDAAQSKLGDNLGNPDNLQENIDFFKAKVEMDRYLQSRAPASNLRILTGTVGRGMMLASVKSPVLNVISNAELAFTEALSRRASGLAFKGTDNKLAISYMKMVNKIYQETGYDLSRMTSIADTGTSGQRVLGDTVHSQGAGKVRKVGRVVEDTVFKQLMGAPDVAFSSAHFADSVNLNALKIAKGDGAKAKTFMKDAMLLEPQTTEGQALRVQGILDAQKATWTDTSWASRVSEGIRTVLNEVSGDFRVGDYLLPFIKTPANVIATGMDYAGLGIPKALVKTVQAFRSGELGSKEHIQSMSRDLVRGGFGITAAVVITSQLKDSDFVGAYDPSRTQIEQLKNSNNNVIRVGGKWISVDYLGPLAVPVTAMMYARKYGNTGAEKTFQYSKAVLAQAQNIPGIADIYDYAKAQTYKKNQSLQETVSEAGNYITSELYSRLVPSFVSDSAKMIDPYSRQGGKGLTGIQAKTPFLNQGLPAKSDIFGEKVRNEPWWSTLLFGSRVKTDKEDAIVREVDRVSTDVDKSVNFTDWNKSSSATLVQFKQRVGQEKYDQARVEYGKELRGQLERVINNPNYQKLPAEKQKQVIDSLDTKAMSTVFTRYHFKYQPTKKEKINL
jgi:hypothetical protein